MFQNKTIKTLGNLMLLVFLCFGQVAAVALNNVDISNVIDPSLSWNTFLGGPDGLDVGSDIFVDGLGDIYIVGTSYSFYNGTYTDPTWGEPNRAFGGGNSDAFVAKLNSSGVLIWSTFLGGSESDDARGIVVDGNGNLYVAGSSTTNWGNPIQPHGSSGSDSFIAKLDASGVLTWHTFLGSSGLTGIDLDASGNIYLTGASTDSWSISNNPLHPHSGNLDAYVAKMTSSGSLSWYTFLGGTAEDRASEIVFGNSGNIYIVGTSYSTWGNPVLPYSNGFWNAFVSKLDSSGTQIWNTFLGAGRDQGTGIAADKDENVYITGISSSTWGSPVRAFEHSTPFPTNSFAAKLNSAGILIYNTFLGNGNDDSNGIALDNNDYVYVIGTSCNSWGNPFRSVSVCPDSFISKLDSSGGLITNGFFGGNSDDYGFKVYTSGDGDVYLMGDSEEGWGNPIRSFSRDLIENTTDGDAFVARLIMPASSSTHVTNANNNGNGSLRQAIINASSGDTITFASYLTGQTIHLASELVVDKSITIDGSSLVAPVTISGDTDNDGDGDVQLISIALNTSATIKNINFTMGFTTSQLKSGGINNLGSLTINEGSFIENIGSQGGAIRNSGNLTVNHVDFTTNSASEGGAILNDLNATATVSNSTFNRNLANGQYGSGGAIGNIGNLIISNCELSENTATLGGGAIVNAIGGTATISDTSFYSNVASTDNGGAIYNTDGELVILKATFYLNTTPLKGGAIYNNSNNINVSNSSFISNKAGGEGGGAIFNNLNATVNIEYSIFNQNTADGVIGGGGAIINIGTLGIKTSEFSENAATIGGGAIVNHTNGTAVISNTTIAKNLSANGGAIINLEYSTLTLINSTLSQNTGGGLYIFGGIIHLKNSILANNIIQPDCYKSGGNIYTSLNTLIENSAIGINSCGTPLLTGDPNLGPLANNGGSTQTMALLSGSPAIDAGDDATCASAPVSNTSQNGITRPQGSHCDIGAYESEPLFISDTVGIFRPSTATFYLRNSNSAGTSDITKKFGLPGDYPIVGDWNGDGIDTIGVYRKGVFYLSNSNTSPQVDISFAFGKTGDQPIAGDWDGDGIDTIGIYRTSAIALLLRNSNSAGPAEMTFKLGKVGDVAITGDWDLDGKDSTGVFRPSNGIIYLKNANSTGFADIFIYYGIKNDKPVAGDWNADGVDTIGIHRADKYYLRNTNTVGYADLWFVFGLGTDMPVVGDWDGLP